MVRTQRIGAIALVAVIAGACSTVTSSATTDIRATAVPSSTLRSQAETSVATTLPAPTTTTAAVGTTIPAEHAVLTLGTDVLCPFGATEPLTVETSPIESRTYGIVVCDLLLYQASFNLAVASADASVQLVALPVPPGWANTPTLEGPFTGLPAIEGNRLEILSKARGIGDCGFLGRWRLTDKGPVLEEFRDQPCLDRGGPLPSDWLVVYTEADGLLDPPVPDGSGCTPGDDTGLPDGTWYGVATIAPDSTDIDLVCLYRGEEAARFNPGFIDYVVINQSPLIRTLPFGENAAVAIWDFESFSHLDLTVLEAIAFAENCDRRMCAVDGGVRLMVAEIIVESGSVVDIHELPSA